MNGIKINTELTITPKTTAKEIAQFLTDAEYSYETIERVVRIYGKFRAKDIRDRAISIVQDVDPGPATPIICDEIQNINSPIQ